MAGELAMELDDTESVVAVVVVVVALPRSLAQALADAK